MSASAESAYYNLDTEPVVWLDLETGGLDPKVHQVTQIAAVATIGSDFAFVKKDALFECKVQLTEGHYTKEALALQNYNGTIWHQEAVPVGVMLDRFKAWLEPHCHAATSKKGTTYQVAHLAGYNLGFDVEFLNATCERNGVGERGYWLPVTKWTAGYLDVMHLALWARAYGGPTHLQFHDLKLETVCRYLGIPIEAHDALHDVYATIDVARELSHRMGLTPQVVP